MYLIDWRSEISGLAEAIQRGEGRKIVDAGHCGKGGAANEAPMPALQQLQFSLWAFHVFKGVAQTISWPDWPSKRDIAKFDNPKATINKTSLTLCPLRLGVLFERVLIYALREKGMKSCGTMLSPSLPKGSFLPGLSRACGTLHNKRSRGERSSDSSANPASDEYLYVHKERQHPRQSGSEDLDETPRGNR